MGLDLISDDEAIAMGIVGRKGHRLEVTQPVAWAIRNADGVQTGAPAPIPAPVAPDATSSPDVEATASPDSPKAPPPEKTTPVPPTTTSPKSPPTTGQGGSK